MRIDFNVTTAEYQALMKEVIGVRDLVLALTQEMKKLTQAPVPVIPAELPPLPTVVGPQEAPPIVRGTWP
jgi:hypothetical protein